MVSFSTLVVGFTVFGPPSSRAERPRQIIDTHVHNAFTSKLNYTFTKSFPTIAHDWNISEFYDAAAEGHAQLRDRISVVLMELDKDGDVYSQSITEAKLYQAVADKCDAHGSGCDVAGIVASAPFTDGKLVLSKFLRELVSVAPRVRAVRDALWKSDVSYYVNETYWESLRALEPFGLPLDLLVRADQIPNVTKLVDALPRLKININHLAYPNISGVNFDTEWAENMKKLAMRPNVYMKLSGLPQAYKTSGWTAEDFQPYVNVAVESFGPSRLNYAGNWFVLNLFGNYSSMYDAVETCLRQVQKPKALSERDLDQIFAGTAKSLYRLHSRDDAAQDALLV